MVKTVKYPVMRYHPENGSYVTCNGPEDVPEGFLDNMRDVENPVLDKYEGPFPATAADFASVKFKKTAAKKAPVTKAKKAQSLKNLKLTRKEALEILDDEKIAYDPDDDNATIAALVAEIL